MRLNNVIKTILIVFVLSFFAGCNDTVSQIGSNKKASKIEVILSKYGREISIQDDETRIPKNELFKVYSLKLNCNGKLTTYRGFGELKRNSISLNRIIDSANIQLSLIIADSINLIAQKLYNEKGYYKSEPLTDDWLISLKIDNKYFVYFRGEGLDNNNLDFINIVDLIVRYSALKVERYP